MCPNAVRLKRWVSERQLCSFRDRRVCRRIPKANKSKRLMVQWPCEPPRGARNGYQLSLEDIARP
jgi:hypothetical protein